MTSVNGLTISNLRVLERAAIKPAGRLNMFTGANASGKTSILEALYILARGRSFREAHWRAIIREGTDALRVVAQVNDAGRSVTMGIEHDKHQAIIRVAGEPQRTARALVESLPLQIVHPDSHRLVEQGPSYRRQYLDWGVFHVEHRFFGAWQRYRKALKQRNAALRTGCSPSLLEPWEQEMATTAAEIDTYRCSYVDNLLPYLLGLGSELLQVDGLRARYQKGWRGDDLREVLRTSRESDRQQGYTRSGPHRADLDLSIGEHRAIQRVSRGQQKALVFALLLAQARLMSDQTAKVPVLLIDDIGAELDKAHMRRVWDALQGSPYQGFVTGTEIPAELRVEPPHDALFHVEHGRVARVL